MMTRMRPIYHKVGKGRCVAIAHARIISKKRCAQTRGKQQCWSPSPHHLMSPCSAMQFILPYSL
eukprot:21687-Eustigmatos_ZCMA.PRE.1